MYSQSACTSPFVLPPKLSIHLEMPNTPFIFYYHILCALVNVPWAVLLRDIEICMKVENLYTAVHLYCSV